MRNYGRTDSAAVAERTAPDVAGFSRAAAIQAAANTGKESRGPADRQASNSDRYGRGDWPVGLCDGRTGCLVVSVGNDWSIRRRVFRRGHVDFGLLPNSAVRHLDGVLAGRPLRD